MKTIQPLLFTLALLFISLLDAHALSYSDISDTDAFQYTNITINSYTPTAQGIDSIDGMFGGVGYPPNEPGTTIFNDYTLDPSVLDPDRGVDMVEFTTNTPTTLVGVNIFLAEDFNSHNRAAITIDLFADTDGIPGFQLTDDHVLVTVTYDENGDAYFFVPFATTATHFLFEAEPYFDENGYAQYPGIRVQEIDAVTAVPQSPQLTAAVSRKTHGGSGNFDLQLALGPAGSGTVEPRTGGPTEIVFSFNEGVMADDGMISANEFTISNATFGSASISGDTITLNLIGVVDQSVVNIALNGISSMDGVPLSGDNDVEIRALFGDADQSQIVDRPDLMLLKSHNREAVNDSNFVLDLDLDGVISKWDARIVQMNKLHTVP